MKKVVLGLPLLLSCTGALHSLDLLPAETPDAPRSISTQHYRIEFNPKSWTQYATHYRVTLGTRCEEIREWIPIETPTIIALDESATSVSFQLQSSSSRVSDCRTIPLTRGDLVELERPYEAGKIWGTWVVPEATAGNTTTLCHGAVTIGRDACIHAGEIFYADIPGVTSCQGVSTSDSLNAFDWTCAELSQRIRVSTKRLKVDHGLGQLISDYRFKDNFLFVEGPDWGRRSRQKLSWENDIIPAPTAGGSNAIDLFGQNSIYVAATPIVVPGYRLLTENISLVALPGASISATAPGGNNCNGNTGPNGGSNLRCLVTSDSRYFWVEGSFGLAGTTNGFVFAPNADFGVVKSVQLLSAPEQHGIYFWGSAIRAENLRAAFSAATTTGIPFSFAGGSYNIIERVRVNNVRSIGLLADCSYCWIHDISIANSASSTEANSASFVVSSSIGVRASKIRILNSRQLGIRVLLSNDITLQDVVVVGSQHSALSVVGTEYIGTSRNVRLQNAHLSNGLGEAVKSDLSEAVLLQNTGLFNNLGAGLSLQSFASDPQTHNVASVGNGVSLEWDVGADIQKPLRLSGEFMNGTSDSCVTGPNSDAGFDSSCNPVNPSTANLVLQDSSMDPWLSRINNRDSTNRSSLQSNLGIVTMSGSLDWFDFDNPFRLLFRNVTNLFVSSARGSALGSSEAIWDLSLKSNSWLKRAPALSPGSCHASLSQTQTFNNMVATVNTPVTALSQATELLNDGIGNDDGFCTKLESCLFTPNIGPYQGHGNLVKMCSNPGPDVSWSGTKIWAYSVNGY